MDKYTWKRMMTRSFIPFHSITVVVVDVAFPRICTGNCKFEERKRENGRVSHTETGRGRNIWQMVCLQKYFCPSPAPCPLPTKLAWWNGKRRRVRSTDLSYWRRKWKKSRSVLASTNNNFVPEWFVAGDYCFWQNFRVRESARGPRFETGIYHSS